MSESPVGERWYRNTTVISAFITGVLGLVGTWITVRNSNQPSTMPDQNSSSLPDSPTVSSSDYLLNFVQFQRTATNSTLSQAQRAQFAEKVLNKTVVWKGYVDEVVPMPDPTNSAAVTVVMVEAKEKLDQSMLKTPALFRLGRDAAMEIQGLQSGQQVTMTGVVAQHSLLGTIVEEGRVLR